MTVSLEKQIFLYSLDTSAFYNDEEYSIHRKLLRSYRYRDHLNTLGDASKRKQYISKRITRLKNSLHDKFNQNDQTRKLRADALKQNKIISMFDSVLTRVLQIEENFLTEDVIVVQSYHYKVLESIIKNGFDYNGEHYNFFTSSAGQIRQKKSIFIKSVVWEKHKDTLTCGLSIDDINQKGGSNVNKYLSYLALSNSASDHWKDFNIHKAIVVDDLEMDVHSLVDYIDRDTYEINRQTMDIPIELTDGCGMVLPHVSKKSFMCRLPWLKGLVVPFPYDKFTQENDSYIVKDIYGKEWNIKEDGIEVIFTKSQFKLWKYYSSWGEYKEKFIKHSCQAAKLNEEDTSNSANLNYQMLQSLTDISDEELEIISKKTIEDITNLGNDKETILRVLGATEFNKRKNHFQEALYMYPELINDEHSKQVIKDKKKSLIKDAKAGKLEVNGRYTFICPDLYAFSERLFLGIENPNGLLESNEVYCNLYKQGKVDILRSPHLYREHGVRDNVIDKVKSKWFITNGIYTSVKDPISKMLQFDNDGDKALVIQEETIVKVAERNMEGIVPLYYEMAKAGAEEINGDNIYNSLVLAYKANIGEISNNITKIWNSDNVDLNVIKWLCMLNNYVIDFAKTLFMPSTPDFAKEIINDYIKSKVPHFFIHAKDKEEGKVEKLNNSTVNKLEQIIPKKRINFVKIAGNLDYKMLMKNENVVLDDEIIATYVRLDTSKKWLMKQRDDLKSNDKLYIYKYIRDELLKINNDPEYITDVLVEYLYGIKKSKSKTSLWESFGDMMVDNLKFNLNVAEECCDCNGRFKQVKQRQVRCDSCQRERDKINARLRKRKQRNAI